MLKEQPPSKHSSVAEDGPKKLTQLKRLSIIYSVLPLRPCLVFKDIHAGQDQKPVERGADVYFRIHGIRKNRMR